MTEKYKPKKSLGQNFLTNKGIAQKLINSAQITSKDLVLEIGPGKGILTKELAKRAKRVIAVEKDKKLVELLERELKDYPNVKIVKADILKRELPVKSYKLVSNLPFYITSPVIRRFLESKNPPQMALIIQKEVAQRITAKPPKMSLLAVSVQAYAKAKIVSYVSKGSFKPTPKVDSAIIKIIPQKTILPQDFFRLVKAGFSSKRKQLANNLSKELNIKKEQAEKLLKKTSINPKQRAETLTIKDWKSLAINYSNMV